MAVEPVAHVEVLLEVVAEREVQERPPAGGQLHRGGQAALDDGEVAGGQVAVELVDVGPDFQPVMGGQAPGIDPRPGHHDHPKIGHPVFGFGVGGDHAAQQVAADAGAADGHDAQAFVVAVAERLAVGELAGVEAGDVAGEVVVLLGPVADQRQPGAEGVRDDVAGVADEDGAVANPREPGDVLDHLGVVVGGQECLALAGAGHRQPADEIGEPGVGGPFLFWVLVQVVVQFPGFVADPQVVVFLAGQVVEDHEVGEQDLVHPPDGLEGVQVVPGRLGLDVPGLAGQLGARRVNALTARRQDFADRVLGEPVDFEAGMELAQLIGDRHIPLRVAQADWRADVERAPRPAPAARPAGHRRRRAGEVAEQQVERDRVARMRRVPGTVERDQRPVRQLGERGAGGMGPDRVVAAVHDQHRAADPGRELAHRGLVEPWRGDGRDQSLRRCLQAPADAVLDLLGRVRFGERLGEEELQEVPVAGQPVVPVELLPALVFI